MKDETGDPEPLFSFRLSALSFPFPAFTLLAGANTMKTFTYRQISPSQLRATDLAAEASTLSDCAAFVITIYEAGFHTSHAEAAEALYSDGRLGIAWGADATWA